eukprot:Sdes_comp23292_c0_seq1m21574
MIISRLISKFRKTKKVEETFECENQENSSKFTWTKSSSLILLTGFAISFDSGIVYISIQPYWHILAPRMNWFYGFVFGSFDLAQFLFLPLFAWISEKIGLKKSFLIALSFNLVGNLFYSLAMFVHIPNLSSASTDVSWDDQKIGYWQFAVVGRFLAGIGSSSLALGLIDITKRTNFLQRTWMVSIYQGACVFARSIGPCFAFPLMVLKINFQEKIDYLFNFFTIPGWITFFISFLSFSLIFLFYENPQEVNPFEGEPDEEEKGRKQTHKAEVEAKSEPAPEKLQQDAAADDDQEDTKKGKRF